MPSLTVGNGLCAVPLRGKYTLCGQPEPPTVPAGMVSGYHTRGKKRLPPYYRLITARILQQDPGGGADAFGTFQFQCASVSQGYFPNQGKP